MGQPASSETRLSKDLPTQTPSETAKLLSWHRGVEKGLRSGVTEPQLRPPRAVRLFPFPLLCKNLGGRRKLLSYARSSRVENSVRDMECSTDWGTSGLLWARVGRGSLVTLQLGAGIIWDVFAHVLALSWAVTRTQKWRLSVWPALPHSTVASGKSVLIEKLFSFVRAAMTECHKLGGLVRQKCIVSRLWRLEVQHRGVSRAPFEGRGERICFRALLGL